MKLVINIDPISLDYDGYVVSDGPLSDLLTCKNCINRNNKVNCEYASPIDTPIFSYVTFCTTWRPTYEIIC